MITQRARYAFKALLALARAGRALQTGAIAEAEAIPQAFLERILLDLKRGGFVTSIRGRSGGYILAQPPGAITAAAVLRLIDGPVAPLPCLSITAYRRCDDCRDESGCGVRRIFARADAAERAELQRTTLADALRPGPSPVEPARG